MILAAAAYALRPRNLAGRRPAIRFLIQPPANNEWGYAVNNQTLAISPEGGRLAFIGRAVDKVQIWIRSLDSLQPRPLMGTAGAYSLFWAGDSRSVLFFADGKLKKAPIAGGPPQTLCEFGESVWKGSTLPNGDFLVNTNSGVFRVSSNGTAIPLPNKLFLWPEILPDGEHVLYRRRQSPMTWTQSIHSGGPATELIPTGSRVEYAPPLDSGDAGYLLYLKGGTLIAQPFDGRRLRVEGEPIAIDQGIPYFEPTGGAPFSVSRDDILVYQTGLSRSRLVWVDRAGRELSTISEPADFFGAPRLSPDDQKVAVSQRTSDNGGADLWIFERGRQGPTRLTSDPGIEAQPAWSPDGKRIVFSSAQKAQPQLWWKSISDSGRGQAVSPAPFQIPTDWSKDGRLILFQTTGGDSDAGVWVVPTETAQDGSRSPVPLIQDHFTNGGGTFSPDGKWVAFVSSAAGKPEVYVQAFQEGPQPKVHGERHRISHEGGTLPRWGKDGKELFFVSGDNRLMAAAIQLDPAFEAAEPVSLFRLRSPLAVLAVEALGFDVASDGQHFIVGVMDAAGSPSVTMIVNWQAELSESRAQ
jgi:dipeptidyl aminopeptidase/acylaminoacyl peptidase